MIDRTSQEWAHHEEGAEPLAALLEDLLQSWDRELQSAPSDRAMGSAGGESASTGSPGVEQLFAALSQRLSNAAEQAAPPEASQAAPAPEQTADHGFDDTFEAAGAEPPAGFLWLSELPDAGASRQPAPEVEIEPPTEIASAPEPLPAAALTVPLEDEAPEPIAAEPEAPAQPVAEVHETLWSEQEESAPAGSVEVPEPSIEDFAASVSLPPRSAQAEPAAPAPAKRQNLAAESGEVKIPISEYAPNDRYLLFRMAGGVFALSLPGVSEAERLPSLTAVPGMPGFLRGIFSHRGEIVPLVNLPELLGLESEDQPLSTGKIMIVRSPHGPLALAAETLEGLSGIYPHEIDLMAELGGTLRPAVRGTAQLGNRTVCVLDLEKVFALDKLRDLVGADSAIPETV